MEAKRGRSFTENLHGLMNQGSTCYLNSVLQVLYWTKQYRQIVIRHPDNSDFIDVQLAVLFKELKERTGTTVGVTRKLGIQRVNQQQDSAEHFEKILSLSSPEASKVFRGLLVHKTICHGCNSALEAEGPFWHLPLPLVNSHRADFSVIEGMEEFFRSSEFSGDNQVYCEGCDSKQDATVACEMKLFPAVLTLLLKRFEFSYKFMNFIKNNRAVDVPFFLNIPQLQDKRYELFAFIDHSGTLKSGHYTATIKCQQGDNQRWVTFNDRQVHQSNFNHWQVENDNAMFKSNSAYLLFYRKQTHVSNENIKLQEENAEDEKQTQRNKRVKREGEGGERKEEEQMYMDDRKRKLASNKAQVEVRDDVIAERNNVVEAPREEKDGKTNRAMLRGQEDERKKRQEMEDDGRNREIRNPKVKEAQVHEEKLERRKEEHVHMDDRKIKPASNKAQVEVRVDVTSERNDVVEAPRKEKDGKTNRPMLRCQEDERKKRLEMEDDGRNSEIRNPKVNEAQVHEQKPESRKESSSKKPDRRRSSEARDASPGPKRQENKDQDEGDPRNRKSGSDKQSERKTEKQERKVGQDQADKLEPLQEDTGNPSDSTASSNPSDSRASKKKGKRKWWQRLKPKKDKQKKDEKDKLKKDKKDKLKKEQKNKNWSRSLFCGLKANHGSDD